MESFLEVKIADYLLIATNMSGRLVKIPVYNISNLR